MSNPTITGNSSNINISNANLYVDGNITATTYIGDGGLLSNIAGGGGGGTGTLQQVTDSGNTTSNTTQFTNSDVGVVATGNIHASYFKGNGSELTGFATVAITGDYTDLSSLPSFNNVAFSGLYSELTGTPTNITDLGVTDGTSGQFMTTDGAGNFTFATVSGGGSSNLQDVTDFGNVTSNTIQFTNTTTSIVASGNIVVNGGNIQSNIVSGNNPTELVAASNTLTIDMDGLSYKTFTCSTSNSISDISVTGDILGSQGMVFLSATGDITINGNTSGLSGSNVHVSYDDISVSSGEKALIGFMSDGNEIYINAAKYPSAGGGGGLSNLDTIITNGNVTSNTVQFTNSDVGVVATGNIQANYFIGDGSQLTNLPAGGGGGGSTTKEYFNAYATGSQTLTSAGIIVNFATTRTNSNASVFSISSGTVTISKTATFMITSSITTDVTDNNRSESLFNIRLSTGGGGFTNIPGTTAYMYNRTSAPGESTGTAICIIDLTSGDQIRVVASEDTGNNVITVANGCSLNLLEVS